MKFIPKLSAALLVAMMASNANAQKLKLTEGDLSALKGQTELNSEFTYDGLRVGKFDKEDDYIHKKTEEYNGKEAGRGDTWAKAWKDDREARYEPKFSELFNEYAGLKMNHNKSAKYTLIFKTSFIEPGYNVGVWRKNASMDGEVWIVETANPSKPVAKISVEKAQGRVFGGFDFDTGVRIAEAYADAGKALGKFVKGKID
ncbi:hypothetical protein F0L74_19060 [Chitinophaga agrisoli]|uniref:DUF4410 domain-containing protein n=1 Tax=Chitinophaga agrisoli TaxID=2607653 RepID=A0A5B2VV27_9BACT|nr:hypothetical protein [Chitinophaga agrisoli]KAA2241959.1 hypothetical protein F0L74_19060 [Chitinophaga agrisoli]